MDQFQYCKCLIKFLILNFFDLKTFKPCFTIARFKPIKGTTSHTVPRDTKSKYSIKFGSTKSFSLNQFLFLNSLFKETKNMKETPAAHKYCKFDLSSIRFGFTIENASGNLTSD